MEISLPLVCDKTCRITTVGSVISFLNGERAMPQYVRTPDEIFRAHPGQPLYFIEFHFQGKRASIHGAKRLLGCDPVPVGIAPDDPPGRADLLAWLAEHCPACDWEPLAPLETSGLIEGGIEGRIRVNFDAAALARYAQRWETDAGQPRDPRWTCYEFPYDHWLSTRYPKTAELISQMPRIQTIRGESFPTYALTPLYAEETGLPCTLGLYWDLEDNDLRPRALLYHGENVASHASIDLCKPHHVIGDIGLSLADLALCQREIDHRAPWLLSRFVWNDESQTETLSLFRDKP